MASFKTSDGCNIAYQLHLSGKPGAPRVVLATAYKEHALEAFDLRDRPQVVIDLGAGRDGVP